MNFQAMSKQRTFILLASATGVISLFFPWAVIDLFMMHKNINGFHSYGITVFLSFAATCVICLLGNQQKTPDKTIRPIVMAAGFMALLFTIIFLMNVNNIAGLIAKVGFGMWISLFAAIAIITSGWLLKSSDTGFKTGVNKFKRSISIPIMNAPGANANSVVNTIDELEKLHRLKENGGISEEEFQQLKSQLL